MVEGGVSAQVSVTAATTIFGRFIDAFGEPIETPQAKDIAAWTAEYVAMRALGDPDAFPHSDLGLLRALRLDKPAALKAEAEAWRPWRAYAAVHLWNGQGSGG